MIGRRIVKTFLFCWILLATSLQSLGQNVLANDLDELKTCKLIAGPSGMVEAFETPNLIVLLDGRKLSLAGIWPLQSVQDFESKINNFIGQEVVPFYAELDPNPFGVQAAHVVAAQNQTWIQKELLRRGQAFFYVYPGIEACPKQLLSQERAAKLERQSGWNALERNKVLLLAKADDDAAQDVFGVYAIITGELLSIGKTNSWHYLNFSNHYKTDFTVQIRPKVFKQIQNEGLYFNELVGKNVEVRGVLQQRNGPMIELFSAAQITTVE